MPVIQTANLYLVNFYVALFPPGWEPIQVTASDSDGRRLAGCALIQPLGVLPPCPGK